MKQINRRLTALEQGLRPKESPDKARFRAAVELLTDIELDALIGATLKDFTAMDETEQAAVNCMCELDPVYQEQIEQDVKETAEIYRIFARLRRVGRCLPRSEFAL